MTRFMPAIPLDVPLSERCVDGVSVDASFWEGVPTAGSPGCFVFEVSRTGARDDYLPLYVGRAERSFALDCFKSENLDTINRSLRQSHVDFLKLILIPYPHDEGEPNQEVIAAAEWLMIHMAKAANPDLLNDKPAIPTSSGESEGSSLVSRASLDSVQFF